VADLLSPLLGPLVGDTAALGVGVVLALVLATSVQMVLGELMPKTAAIAHPEAMARWLGGAVAGYGLVFGPVIRFLDGAANRTVRMLGVEPAEELSQVRTLAEFDLLFRSAAEGGELQPAAAELLARTLRLAGRTAADVLVPRTSVEGLPIDATVTDLVTRSRRTGHSRFVVFGVDLDDLRGVVHVKSAYQLNRGQRDITMVTTVMGELLAVPEGRDLNDLLSDMRSTRHHLVAVVDEHGGTAGIVTLEDVIEQVVGDITDEHDVRSPALTRPVRPGEWVLDGTVHVDEVVGLTGLGIADGPYETLAGWVLDRMGRIPDAGDGFDIDGWSVTVESMDRHRVARVILVAPT
jgi:CBS domain containing-hemolysin-like protein